MAVTPEIATDEVVASIRRSWLHGVGNDARFCVASGQSVSKDETLHWLHGLNRSDDVATGRADLNSRIQPSVLKVQEDLSNTSKIINEMDNAVKPGQRRPTNREIMRVYNNFLRHKVFQMLRDMCRRRKESDFSFMMDADTAVNRTNLQRFVQRIVPNSAIYTGLCKRRSSWTKTLQRGVGGGPGILFSTAFLDLMCPRLEVCAPLRSLMNRLIFAGGDLMIAKCVEFLGHQCSMEQELP